jgi:Flp pilus assembly protein TadD
MSTLKERIRIGLLIAPTALVIGCAHHAITASVPAAPPALLKTALLTTPSNLKTSLKTSPASATTRQTINAIDTGDGDLQARILRARVDANPSDTNARLDLARYYLSVGFPEVAAEHLRLACERDPESSTAHIFLARILRDEQRPAEAASVLRAFSERYQDDVEIWAWLGVLEDEAGDLKAGEAASRRAIALAPNRDDLENNLGYSLLDQGRTAEAADVFRAALAINAKSAIARNNLGLALAENPREALLNWQAVEGPASAHNNMAVALIESGRYPEARTEIQTALNYEPHHAAALNNLALVSELDGRPAEVAAHQETPHHLDRFANSLVSAWHRFWSGSPNERNKEPGNTFVSR